MRGTYKKITEKDIYIYLKDHHKEEGITLKDLADAIGTSMYQVQKYITVVLNQKGARYIDLPPAAPGEPGRFWLFDREVAKHEEDLAIGNG